MTAPIGHEMPVCQEEEEDVASPPLPTMRQTNNKQSAQCSNFNNKLLSELKRRMALVKVRGEQGTMDVIKNVVRQYYKV